MPIVYCTSFHGLDVPGTLPGLTYPTGSATNANVLTRYFGIGDATASSVKRNGGDSIPILIWQHTYNTGSATGGGYCFTTVAQSSFDAKSKALVGGHFKTAIGAGLNNMDTGPVIDLRNFMNANNPKVIVGFRAGTVSIPGCSYVSDLVIGGISTSAATGSLTTIPVPPTANAENYIEFVVERVDATNDRITIFVNDVQRFSSTTTFAKGFWVGRRMTSAASNSLYPVGVHNHNVEIRDLYIMTVTGENDIRVGSSASVVKLDLDSDSSAQFRRPDGYASNASVAKGDMTLVEGDPLRNGAMTPKNPDQILVGDEVGQQDLYNLDISSATSTLGSVDAVSIRSVAMTPGAASRSFSAIARSGANQVASAKGATVLGSGNEYQLDTLVLNADPADDSRWNLTKLAGLKVGTKLVS